MAIRLALVRSLTVLALLATAEVSAAPPTAGSSTPNARELPELPRAPDELKQASLADLAELDELLTRIAGEDAAAREDGVRGILELAPRLVPAIRKRIDGLGDSSE
jgi:hypothetical protein